MASNQNSVLIEGNIVRDPVTKTIPSGTTVCNFTIASNRFYKKGEDFEKETSYFDIQCWGKIADYVNMSCGKGTPVKILGRLKQDRWQQEGQNKSRIVIVAGEVSVQQRQERQYDNLEHEPAGDRVEGRRPPF